MSDAAPTQRSLRAGEVLFRMGDSADCAYLIDEGAVEVVLDHDGKRRLVALLGRHELIGEMALLGDNLRSATVQARADTTLTIITPSFLAQRLDGSDPLLRHLLRVLSDRCRHMLDPHATSEGTIETAALSAYQRDRDRTVSRLHMQQSLEHALADHEFSLNYQPIIALADGEVAGFEALLRWQHPIIGPVSPAEFIPQAEETDLINRVGYWIIEEACTALAFFDLQCKALGRPPAFLTINLSSRQLEDPQLLPFLQTALHRHRFDPERLKLEVTETLMMKEMEPAIRILNACRAAGLKVALDDFGTGYSSLAYLHRLPVDTLKLDRAFIKQLHDGAASRVIARGVSNLAHELGIDVVGEGVETESQAEALKEIGADFAQGFLYSRALPQEQATAFLRTKK